MKESILLFLGCWVGLTTLDQVFTYEAAYDVGYGAVALLALLISVTFSWLWRVRATPLAAGMALSWLGCAGVIGYWWIFSQMQRGPQEGFERELLLMFVALYLGGGIMHLRVISGAHWAGLRAFWAAVTAIGVIAFAAAFTVG